MKRDFLPIAASLLRTTIVLLSFFTCRFPADQLLRDCKRAKSPHREGMLRRARGELRQNGFHAGCGKRECFPRLIERFL